MTKKSVQLAAEDYTYFVKLTDALKEYETKIAALEITKLKLFNEYELIYSKMEEFVKEIKIKYNIPVDNAELDDSTKCIVYYMDDVNENTETKSTT